MLDRFCVETALLAMPVRQAFDGSDSLAFVCRAKTLKGITIGSLRNVFGPYTAWDGVSFHVPENTVFCVMRPSGCGKSTLLCAIAGLEALDAARITLEGASVFDKGIQVPPEGRQVGVLFQSYPLSPNLSVARTVSLPYEAKGAVRA
jgi:iron(III) transport system ATP-binding protein